MDMIKSIVTSKTPNPNATPFKFESTNEATSHNATIVKTCDFDMTRVISDHPNSHMSYESEFRSTSILYPLLHRGPF